MVRVAADLASRITLALSNEFCIVLFFCGYMFMCVCEEHSCYRERKISEILHFLFIYILFTVLIASS